MATKVKAKSSEATTRQQSETLTTAIHIRRDQWELLREVAFNRARESGGRASVSAVISELIEHQKARLERELARTS